MPHQARKEYSPDGSPYIAGKIVSKAQSGFNVKYGRVEARINFPSGQGFWPSFWMLPDRYKAPGPYGYWPASG
jgi:beta-glucanase (GH16 family)